jgi:hypothetical protein
MPSKNELHLTLRLQHYDLNGAAITPVFNATVSETRIQVEVEQQAEAEEQDQP